MAQVIADRRDVDFVLFEQFQLDELSKNEVFADFNKKTIDMIVTEVRGLAVKEILPTMKVGDHVGCKYEKGEVTTPQEYKRAWALLQEGEWLAPTRDPKWGGQGMPETLALAIRDYLFGANSALLLFGSLTHGAARLVELFGTDAQKEIYLKKMYTGQWSGTMLLTESEAGSDLGALTTTATRNPDGTFSLTGNKIFITGGDQDLTENIIHQTLARIEGAPAGSRGISLFLVPKFRVNADGTPGESNDVVCTGIEEKMGLHGSSTCSLALGGKGSCIGMLLGEENKGLAEMFVMMNEERLVVGLQAMACASSSYLHALEFARTRIQGPMLGSKDAKGVAIINHPDVRRMLMTMKVYVEGMRSLLYFIANCEDKKHLAQSDEEKETYQDLIDVLIPLGKGYVSDRSVQVCDMGIQVFGGYGYTSEYPVEQLLRDARICPIYEGTNGIQAMDLLGRKLGLKKGKLFTTLMAKMQHTVSEAKAVEAVKPLAAAVESSMAKLREVGTHLGKMAMSAETHKAFANAALFLEASGDVVMGWMLLWRACIAAKKIESGAKAKDLTYYQGQVKSAEFFITSVLPVTLGRMDALMNASGAAVEIADEAFGGK